MHTEEDIIRIGEALIDTFKYQKAVDFFTEAIKTYPLNAEIFELRGIAWFRIYAIDEAINDTTKAIELDSNNHRAWYNKGEILKYKKQYKAAEECYEAADKIYPGSLFYLTGLIMCARAQKKHTEAIGYCNQILKEEPGDTIALTCRGASYAGLLNYEAAVKDYLKLIDLGKRTANVYNALGFWYSKLNDLKKAANNLAVALQLRPSDPYALDNMGYVHYQQGNYNKALQLINESLEIDPSNSYGYKNRALVYLKTGRKEDALTDLLKAKQFGYKEDYDNETDDLLHQWFGM